MVCCLVFESRTPTLHYNTAVVYNVYIGLTQYNMERVFIDVQIVSPNVESNRNKDVSKSHSTNEDKKIYDYNQRIIQVEKMYL